jgi:hypothetical protein
MVGFLQDIAQKKVVDGAAYKVSHTHVSIIALLRIPTMFVPSFLLLSGAEFPSVGRVPSCGEGDARGRPREGA